MKNNKKITDSEIKLKLRNIWFSLRCNQTPENIKDVLNKIYDLEEELRTNIFLTEIENN